MSIPQVANAAFPLADTFKLHSLSAATKRIYLDFDGHFTTKTLWQSNFGYGDIDTPAFSLDADYGTFSDVEKAAVQEIWARVAEDFAPFEVDVTTEDPGIDALVNSGAGDNAWGVRVVVGGNGGWAGSAGIAVMKGFGRSDGSPAFAFADQWWKSNPNIVTQCISHEVGHTLGLSHDGPGYYGGHGLGPTSWVPIMGSGDKSLTQWSKGEYNGASNTEDDLAIITTNNGFGYRADDYANTIDAATSLSGITTRGIIERNADVDVFRFSTVGTIKATVSAASLGANLDVLAEILDSSGKVIQSSNPMGAINASFSMNVAAGTYYLRVQGAGEGDPLGTGYTNYGSLGQYTVTMEGAQPPPPVVPTLSISDLTLTEGNAGNASGFVTISLAGTSTQTVTVQWAPRDGTATRANGDYSFPFAAGGTATFTPGRTSVQIDVVVTGDLIVEPNEIFSIVLSNPLGATVSKAISTITIANDDVPPASLLAIAAIAADKPEGNAGTTPFSFSVTRSGGTSNASSVRWEVTGTGANPASTLDFGNRALPKGTVSFAPGEISKSITVNVVGDTIVETDEGFAIVLFGPTAAIITTPTAAAVIRNDDPAVTLAITATAADKLEGNLGGTPFTFTVERSGKMLGRVTANWAVTGSGANPVNATDFTSRVLPSGVVTFASGEMSKVVTVNVAGDTLIETDKEFSVSLSALSTSVIITTAFAKAVIRNDDLASMLAIATSSADRFEGVSGSTPFTFTVTRSGGTWGTVTARWAVTGSGANPANAVDFTNRALPTGFVSFVSGETSRIITVSVAGDSVVEASEGFTVVLSAPSASVIITAAAATAVIRNDDFVALVGASISPPSLAKRGGVFAGYAFASIRR